MNWQGWVSIIWIAVILAVAIHFMDQRILKAEKRIKQLEDENRLR